MKWALLSLFVATSAFADGSGSGSGTVIQLPPDVNAPEVSAAASPSEVALNAVRAASCRLVHSPLSRYGSEKNFSYQRSESSGGGKAPR